MLIDAIRTSDVGFEFVWRNLSAAGRSVGNITLALTGSDHAIDQLVAATTFGAKGAGTGHTPG